MPRWFASPLADAIAALTRQLEGLNGNVAALLAIAERMESERKTSDHVVNHHQV